LAALIWIKHDTIPASPVDEASAEVENDVDLDTVHIPARFVFDL
jgi:hypothetical protein